MHLFGSSNDRKHTTSKAFTVDTLQNDIRSREKITIAFTGCQKSCEGKAFDYLWPILVESKTGQCS